MDDFDDLNHPISTARRGVSTAAWKGTSRRQPVSPKAAAAGSTREFDEARQAGTGREAAPPSVEKPPRRRARPASRQAATPPPGPATPPLDRLLDPPRAGPLATALSALAIGALIGFLAGFFVRRNDR